MKFRKILGAFRKFYILLILASKMIIFTVYTLYLEGKVLKWGLRDYVFGPNLFQVVKVEKIWGIQKILYCWQLGLPKFSQSIHCILVIMLWKEAWRTIFLLRKCSKWSTDESSLQILDIQKILYFANFDFKNDDNILKWGLKDYFFGFKMFVTVHIWKFKVNLRPSENFVFC